MLRLSKLTDYGTVLMFAMARDTGRVHSAGELAALAGVTVPTASKVLKALARKGLVLSRRGAQGGYVLARPPERISLAEVIEALDGGFALTECSAGDGLCPQESACPGREPWQQISRVIHRTLSRTSLAEMAGTGGQPVDFFAAAHGREESLQS